MLLTRILPCLFLLAALAPAQLMEGGVRIVYAFANNPDANCEIELTPDSVRFLSEYRFMDAPGVESIQESSQRRFLGGRPLSEGERDTAQDLMSLAGRWKGYRRFVCKESATRTVRDGYSYSLWSDSLLLNCDNCYNCTGGLSVPDAKVLARFGKMSLWLYGLRQAWRPR